MDDKEKRIGRGLFLATMMFVSLPFHASVNAAETGVRVKPRTGRRSVRSNKAATERKAPAKTGIRFSPTQNAPKAAKEKTGIRFTPQQKKNAGELNKTGLRATPRRDKVRTGAGQ